MSFCVTHKTRLENVKGFEKEIVYVAFDDKEGNEMEKCRAFTVFPDVYNLYFTFSVHQKKMCQMTKGLKRLPAIMTKGTFQFEFTL